MSAFLDALHSGRVLLMDGAMGTELRRAGLPEDGCGEIWNITHPERVQAVHQAYVDAGADVLLTNTFQANQPALCSHWGEGQHFASDYIYTARDLIRPFATANRYALFSVGPVVKPTNNTKFSDLNEISSVVGSALSVELYTHRQCPISGILLETFSTSRIRFSAKRAAQMRIVPVLLSLTYLHDAKGKIVTLSGHKPEWFARRAEDWGIAALGVNCGRDIDMGDIIEIIRRYRQETDLPLFARPNAGTPAKQDGRWVWPHTPESMAARLPELLDAGACMVGGCCGTTPEHIAAFRRVVDQYNNTTHHAAVKK
jgi:5-methyltetrahydrofolate--homocysteine methyltransferase